MTHVVEVFADITCPFAHVGLKRVAEHLKGLDSATELHVKSWPLEWVNGAPLALGPVVEKAAALTSELGISDFSGITAVVWPTSTLEPLALVAAGYAESPKAGTELALALRRGLFEEHWDIEDPKLLNQLAAEHGLQNWEEEGSAVVLADYEEGQRRGVAGSPHFFVGNDDFFCPALDLGHDDDGHLTARFDADGLAGFLESIPSLDRATDGEASS